MKQIRIIFVFIALLLSTKIDAQKIYLVSVGVSDYPGVKNDLLLPAKDAQDIYHLYKTNADATSVLLLNSDAEKSRIVYESVKLFSNAEQDDIVVLFFAGHGDKGGFYTYDAFLTYEDIRVLFSGCKARNKYLFTDACHSGDIRDNTCARTNDPENNILFFLSSRGSETSLENRSMKNGIFTTCLLRSLKGGADIDRDRVITAKELYTAVSTGVIKMSKGRQHPIMWGNFDDSMPVMIWK